MDSQTQPIGQGSISEPATVMTITTIVATTRKVGHTYLVCYPEHPERKDDVHYIDFDHYRRQTVAAAQCKFGVDRGGDFSECDHDNPFELHHAHVEFALMNSVDLKLLEVDYPGISNPDELGAWVEGANGGQNFWWLCRLHHRGPGGVHSATYSDYEAEKYCRGLIQKAGDGVLGPDPNIGSISDQSPIVDVTVTSKPVAGGL